MKKTFQPDALEIIFEHKNKMYGAYRLRREYPEYLMRAFFWSLLLIISAAIIIKFLPRRMAAQPIIESIICCMCECPMPNTSVFIPPPKVINLKPTGLPFFSQRKNVIRFTAPVILPDEIADYLQQPFEVQLALERQTTTVGKTTRDSMERWEENWSADCSLGPETRDSIMDTFVCDKAPMFPGGDPALLEFIHDALEYPLMAKNACIQGTVVVAFVIGKDGGVSNIEILKDIGGGCAREAERVIQSMPCWSPGEDEGHPVNTRLTLPIRFRLE